MAADALRELLAFFGVEVDDKAVKRADEGMHRLEETALKAGEILAEAFAIHEISEFIQGQIEAAARLADTSEMLGIATGDLQAFEFAAQLSGVGAEEADTALRFLNRTMGEALTGNAEAAKSFAALKVELKDATGQARPAQDVLADIADGFTKLPTTAEKTTAAMNIFGRAGARLIPLLNEGGKGIDKLYEEFQKLGGGLDEDFVRQAKQADDEILKLKFAGKGLESVIVAALLPSVMDLVAGIQETVVDLRELTTHSYIAKTALGTLAAISLVLAGAWAIANIEILLIVAALALLILAVDDIYTFFKGGDSLIGRMLGEDKSNQVRKFFEELGDTFDDLKTQGGRIWDAFMQEWPGIKADFQDAEASALRIWSAVMKLVDAVRELGREFGIVLGDGDALDVAVRLVTGSIKGAAGAVKIWSGWFDVISGQMKNIVEGATAVVQSITNITHSANINQHNEVSNVFNVHGGGGPLSTAKAIGAEVGDTLDDALGSAFRALPVGGGH